MRFFNIVIILLATNLYSQNYRFVYEYKFAPDQKKLDSSVTNNMYLETDGLRSFFINETKFKVDSIKNSSNDMTAIIRAGKMDRNLHFTITKDYAKNEVIYHSMFTTVGFRIVEDEKPKWRIYNDVLKFGDYICQKAETFYKGRTWTAYFTQEIPINDGPYKFNGLPGLITRIFSEDHAHEFRFIEVKKVQQIKFPSFKNERLITATQYQQYLENYKPALSDIAAVTVNNGVSSYFLKDGNVVNIQISRDLLEKYKDNQDKLGESILKKIASSADNPIELEMK